MAKKKTTTFEELIKRLEKRNEDAYTAGGMSNGAYAILEKYLEEMQKPQELYPTISDAYEVIYGILWGLSMTDFISEEQHRHLQKQLREIYSDAIDRFTRDRI